METAIADALRQLHMRPVAYYPAYTEIMGSISGGVILSQLLYWWAVQDGHKFHVRDEDLARQTRASEWEMRTAKDRMRKLTWMTISREGMGRKTFYSIKGDGLLKSLGVLERKVTEESPERTVQHMINGAIPVPEPIQLLHDVVGHHTPRAQWDVLAKKAEGMPKAHLVKTWQAWQRFGAKSNYAGWLEYARKQLPAAKPNNKKSAVAKALQVLGGE